MVVWSKYSYSCTVAGIMLLGSYLSGAGPENLERGGRRSPGEETKIKLIKC